MFAILGLIIILAVGGGVAWYFISPDTFPIKFSENEEESTQPMTLTKLELLCKTGMFHKELNAVYGSGEEEKILPMKNIMIQNIERPTSAGVQDLDPLSRIVFTLEGTEEVPHKITWKHDSKLYNFNIGQAVAGNRVTIAMKLREDHDYTFWMDEVDDLVNVAEVDADVDRYALLITCTYEGGEKPLPGTREDGVRMVNYLKKKGFTVTWMRDFDIDKKDPLYPNAANMRT